MKSDNLITKISINIAVFKIINSLNQNVTQQQDGPFLSVYSIKHTKFIENKNQSQKELIKQKPVHKHPTPTTAYHKNG